MATRLVRGRSKSGRPTTRDARANFTQLNKAAGVSGSRSSGS